MDGCMDLHQETEEQASGNVDVSTSGITFSQ
jgi:hypothetical protein